MPWKFSPDERDKWTKEKGMKVFSVYNPKNEFEHIDVLIDYDLNFSNSYKNKVIYTINKIDIPVISIPDLVKLKEKADRIIDRNDIQVLKKIMRLKGEQ